MELHIRFVLMAFVLQSLLSTVTSQRGSKEARQGHIYLATKIPQDGVLVSLWGRVKSRERLWLQIWRPVDSSPREMELLHEKQVASNGQDKTNLTFSFGNSDAMCPIVHANDCIGLYASRDPFPVDWDRNNFNDVYEARVGDNRPRIGDRKSFLDTFVHPFIVGAQTRSLANGEEQTNPDMIEFVNCGMLESTPVPTFPSPTDSTTVAELTTNPMTSLANGTTMDTPGGISSVDATGMYAGIGVAVGLAIIAVVSIAVYCARKRRAPSSEKDKETPAITTGLDIIPTSDLTATRNGAYGMNTDFLHPNTYEAMDSSSQRVSIHDYNPIIPPRDKPSTPVRLTPRPSPKPVHSNIENGSKVAQLKETLGVALPGFSPTGGRVSPKPAVKDKPVTNTMDANRASPYLELMADNGTGYSTVINETAPHRSVDRQDSAGYEQIQL